MSDYPYPEAPHVPGWMYFNPAHPHLGGYNRNGDPGSFNPVLWVWLLKHRNVRSVIDVGCGAGYELRWFADQGCKVLGVEGVPQKTDLPIIQHDYTTGPYRPRRKFDLCWSCEFVEHVEERYIANFLATFRSARLLLMTYARGSGGHHHVNWQSDDDYWIGQVEAAGFRFDRRLTRRTRDLANEHGYYRQTGLAFARV